MINDISAYIEPFEMQIEEHATRLPVTNELVQRSRAFLSMLCDIGAQSMDLTDFLAKVNKGLMLQQMKHLLNELAREDYEVNHYEEFFEEPSVPELAKSYHDAFNFMPSKKAMPMTCQVYEEIFIIEEESIDASEFLMRMAQHGLFLKLSTMPVLDKHMQAACKENMSMPATEVHFREHREMAMKAKSPLEVEYESLRLTEIYMMEVMVDSLLLHDLYGGLYSVLKKYEHEPSQEHRADVRRHFEFINEFFGLTLEEYFQIPRIRDFMEKNVLPREHETKPMLEIDELIEFQYRLLVECLPQQPEPRTQRMSHVRSWDKTIHINEFLEACQAPQRPLNYQR